MKKEPEEFRMTFSSHLEELRKRLLISVAALLAGMSVSYAFRDELFAFILHPLFVARETVEAERSDDDELEAAGPVKVADMAARARKLSRQARETEEPIKAAKLAAEAVDLAAKAVLTLDQGVEFQQQEERRRRQRAIAYTNPVKPFWVSLQLSLVGGIILSFGVIMWEIWAFVAPGLYPKEKRYAAPFIIAATGCFIGGAGFGYRFVFPLGFGFLTRFSREIADAQGIEMMDVTTVDAFVTIAMKLLLAFGLVFELPVLVSFLAMAGIVDHKQLWHFGRWFVVIAVTLGALLTPPDIISQVMMAVPLSVLYLISIGLAYFLHPRRRNRDQKRTKAEAKAIAKKNAERAKREHEEASEKAKRDKAEPPESETPPRDDQATKDD